MTVGVHRSDGCGGGLVAQSCLTLATPWTVAHQAPQSVGLQILAWVAISFSRGSFQPRDQTGLLHCRQILNRLS